MFVLFLPQKVAAFYLRVAQDSECYRKISLNVLFAESKRQEIKQAYISKYNSKLIMTTIVSIVSIDYFLGKMRGI